MLERVHDIKINYMLMFATITTTNRLMNIWPSGITV